MPETPVPPRGTTCGLSGALSVTDSVPLWGPAVVGLNVTLTLQLAPDARPGMQLSVSPKLAVAAMLAMLSATVP